MGVTLAFAAVRPAKRRMAVIVVPLAVAGLAQWLLLDKHFLAGGLLYGAAAACLVAWVRWNDVDVQRLLADDWWSGKREWLAAAAVLGLTTVFRVWQLGDVPYGIEQDEGAWTWAEAHHFLTDVAVPGSTYYFHHFPVGYYQGGLFLRLFGLDMLSVRMEMAFFSIMASLLFYLLIRRLISVPVALIATFLLGISVVDVSSSRLAIVEAKVKFWVILSYFLLFWAIRRNNLGLYLLTGIATAAGMLVYKTFYLTPVVVVLTMLFAMTGNPRQWRHHLLALLAACVPLALVFPRTLDFIEGEGAGTSKAWTEYSATHPNDSFVEKFLHMWQFAGENFKDVAYTLFYRQLHLDFLLVRLDAPIVLAAVLPLVVLGLAVALMNARRVEYAFILLWLLVGFFLGAVSTGVNQVRILYPGLPAVYILAALGTMIVVRSVSDQLTRRPTVIYGATLAVFALFLTGVSWQIYFYDTADPEDRQHRREMVDTVSAASRRSNLVLVPYVIGAEDTVDREKTGLAFAVGGRWGLSHAPEHFKLVPYDQLLASVEIYGESGSLAIVSDAMEQTEVALRDAALQTVRRCYPKHALLHGRSFETMVVPEDQLAAPRCGQILVAGRFGSFQLATGSLTLFWEGAEERQRSYRLVIERAQTRTQLFEAEDIFEGDGWYFDPRFTTGYSGRGYLIDDWQAGRAKGTLQIPEDGRYWVWVRFDQREVTDARPLLYVDEEGLPFQALTEEMGSWAWRQFGPYDLPAGEHSIGVEREYGQDPHVGLFLDAILLTQDEQFDPSVDDPWEQVYDSGEVVSTASQVRFGPGLAGCSVCGPDGLQLGQYRWRVQVFDGDKLVDAFGNRGTVSAWAEVNFGAVIVPEAPEETSVPGGATP